MRTALFPILAALACTEKPSDSGPANNTPPVIDSDDGGDSSPPIDSGCDDPGVWWVDADGDGFGGGAAVEACEQPEGHVSNDADCADDDGDTWPGAPELCDGGDQDCDGQSDEGLDFGPWWPDADADGAGDQDSAPEERCDPPDGWISNGLDCDDSDPFKPMWAAAEGHGVDGTTDVPMADLQLALDLADECLVLLPGFYEGNYTLGRDLEITGIAGPEQTEVRGRPMFDAPTFYIHDAVVVYMSGLTFSGGRGLHNNNHYDSPNTCGAGFSSCEYNWYTGGGLFVDDFSFTSLHDVVFEDNHLPFYSYEADGTSWTIEYGLGGGLYAFGSEIEMRDVVFQDNTGAYGAAAYFSTSIVRGSRVWIRDHQGTANVVHLSSSLLDLENTVVTGSVLEDGPNMYLHYTDASLRQVTFADNQSDADLYTYGSDQGVDITGSIFAAGGNTGISIGNGHGQIAYSDVSGYTYPLTSVTDGGGVIYDDPQFTTLTVDGVSEGDDLTLSAGSPCIDAGMPDLQDPDGSPADMGAYGGPEAL